MGASVGWKTWSPLAMMKYILLSILFSIFFMFASLLLLTRYCYVMHHFLDDKNSNGNSFLITKLSERIIDYENIFLIKPKACFLYKIHYFHSKILIKQTYFCIISIDFKQYGRILDKSFCFTILWCENYYCSSLYLYF